jgi:hypothetical protein
LCQQISWRWWRQKHVTTNPAAIVIRLEKNDSQRFTSWENSVLFKIWMTNLETFFCLRKSDGNYFQKLSEISKTFFDLGKFVNMGGNLENILLLEKILWQFFTAHKKGCQQSGVSSLSPMQVLTDLSNA